MAGLKDKGEVQEEEEEEKEKSTAAAGSQKKKQAKAGKEQSGEALRVQQLLDAARDGDAGKVSTLLSTQGAHSLINYQEAEGPRRFTSPPKKGMRPSRNSSLRMTRKGMALKGMAPKGMAPKGMARKGMAREGHGSEGHGSERAWLRRAWLRRAWLERAWL